MREEEEEEEVIHLPTTSLAGLSVNMQGLNEATSHKNEASRGKEQELTKQFLFLEWCGMIQKRFGYPGEAYKSRSLSLAGQRPKPLMLTQGRKVS